MTNREMGRFVHTGADVANYTMEIISSRAKRPNIVLSSGIPTLDRYMRPLLPGEVVFVIGYTAHGKTSFLQHWTRRVVGALRERETTDEIAVYISYETMVEELGLYDLCSMTNLSASAVWYGQVGEEDLEQLSQAAMRRAALPLWVIGYSLKRPIENSALTLPAITETLMKLQEERGVRPVILFLDFLQNVTPTNLRDDKVAQIWRACDDLKHLARACGAPVVVACQAGREVMRREFKLPEVYDGQWASHIEQMADKIISIWYPYLTEEPGKILREVNAPVTEHLLVCGLRKQRHAVSGQIFPLWFDPATNTLREWVGNAATNTDGEEMLLDIEDEEGFPLRPIGEKKRKFA